MAQYEITTEEFRRYNHSPIVPVRRRIILWSVCLLILVVSLFVGQYAFSLVWAALLILIYFAFYRMAPQIESDRLTNNPFALGPFEVRFERDSYTVRVGETELQLGLSEFGRAHDLGDHYRLDHKSLFSLRVPKRALSEEETQIIERYREKFPGHPENQTSFDY